MQSDSMLNYVRVAMASVMLAALGTAAQAQDLPSFMAPIGGRTDTTSACSRARAGASFSIGPANLRSTPLPSRSSINC
jgi:hypothetical protein